MNIQETYLQKKKKSIIHLSLFYIQEKKMQLIVGTTNTQKLSWEKKKIAATCHNVGLPILLFNVWL